MKISKKKRIALIGSSVLLLGMIPVLVILDPVGFRNMEELTAEEPARETARLYEQVVDGLEICYMETAEIVKVITAESHETDPDVTLLDDGGLLVNFAVVDSQDPAVLRVPPGNYPVIIEMTCEGGIFRGMTIISSGTRPIIWF